jgi:hypothetical protein
MISTHDAFWLSRLLKDLGGHLKSRKLFKLLYVVAEKADVGGSTPSLATTFQSS